MIVERFEIERAVDIQVAAAVDGVAQRGAILQFCTALPRVIGRIGGITVYPVKDGQLVQWQLIGYGGLLLVVEWRTEVLDALPHRILPCTVAVCIEFFVHGGIGLLYLCMGSRLEVEAQVLGEIPAQSEVAVPEELLIEVERHLLSLQVLKVALLLFVVVTDDFRVEADALRQIVQSEGLGEVEPLRLTLEFAERLPRLVDGRIGIVERASPTVIFFVDGRGTRVEAVGVAIAEGKVTGVVGHGVALGLQSPSDTRQGEIRIGPPGDGHRLYTVALLLRSCGIQGILQSHVRIEGIIARAYLLLGDGVIKGHRHLCLLGEEFTQFERCRHGVLLLSICTALHDTFFQSSEAITDVMACHVDTAEVGELHIEVA